MPLPNLKFSALFEYGKAGWSEDWWTNKTNFADLESVAESYAQLRYGQTAGGVSVIGARLTDTDKPRSGYVVEYDRFVAPAAPVGPQANLSEAWLVRLRSDDNTQKRNFYMRGLSSPLVKTPVVGDRFEPTTKIIRFKDDLVSFLGANGLGVRSAGHLNDVGTQTTPIVSIDISADGYLLIQGPGIGAVIQLPAQPMILSGFTGKAARLNGTYGPLQTAFVNATTVKVKVQASLVEKAAYVGVGANARIPKYTLGLLKKGELEYLSDKNTGRAFFVPRGRRRNQR